MCCAVQPRATPHSSPTGHRRCCGCHAMTRLLRMPASPWHCSLTGLRCARPLDIFSITRDVQGRYWATKALLVLHRYSEAAVEAQAISMVTAYSACINVWCRHWRAATFQTLGGCTSWRCSAATLVVCLAHCALLLLTSMPETLPPDTQLDHIERIFQHVHASCALLSSERFATAASRCHIRSSKGVKYIHRVPSQQAYFTSLVLGTRRLCTVTTTAPLWRWSGRWTCAASRLPTCLAPPSSTWMRLCSSKGSREQRSQAPS